MFEKLYKFIGKSIKLLIERDDESYCLRLQKLRVFYVRESLMRRATNVRTDFCISPLLPCRILRPSQRRVDFRLAAKLHTLLCRCLGKSWWHWGPASANLRTLASSG